MIFLTVMATACILALLVGCVNTIDGHKKAGIPFIKDKIESRYERPADQVFAVAKSVLEFNGTLYGENTITRTLEAKVNTRTVWVKVEEEENGKISHVIVQVRKKGGTSDIDLASEIDKQIALRLKN